MLLLGSGRRNFCVAVVFLTASFAPTQVAPKPAHVRVAVASATHFDLVDNRIFVSVRLNGRGPFRFILDSGSDGHLIRPEVAKQLGLKPEGNEQGKGNGASSEEGWQTHIASVQLGSFTLLSQEAAVLPFSQALNLFGTARVDGILGLPAFQQQVLKIDYDQRRLTFTPFDKFIYTGSGKVLTFEQNSDDIPAVFANLDGIPGNFGLDTGARASLLLFPPFVEKNLLAEKYSSRVEGVTGWGFGGPVKTKLARARKLDLGGFSISNPITRLMTQPSGTSSSAEEDGLIGEDVLKQFNVIFDYKHHQIILEPNRRFGHQDSYDRTGMWVAQDGNDFPVVDVIANGPAAEAGIAPGDKITAINGVPAARLALPELRERWSEEPPGTKLHLTVIEKAGADPVVKDPPGDPPVTQKTSPLKKNAGKEIVLVLRDLV